MRQEDTILTYDYESPFGPLTLGSFRDRLCMCDWQNAGHRGRVYRRLMRLLGAGMDISRSAVTERAVCQLDEFFARRRLTFDIPLLLAGTDFQKRVWLELLNIPYGKTVSYGELARRMGKPEAVRATANAVGANALSLFVPCHRVIGSDNSLTGYAGGTDTKRRLLRLEHPA